MADFRVDVLHLDDQPDQASWVPRSIYYWFCDQFPDETAQSPDPIENREETEFSITLKFGPATLVLGYRISETVERMQEDLTQNGKHTAVVLLDQAIGDDYTAGATVFRRLSDQRLIEPNSIVFLTAYPNLVCEQLSWNTDDHRIVVKPPNKQLLIRRLVNRMAEFARASRDSSGLFIAERLALRVAS